MNERPSHGSSATQWTVWLLAAPLVYVLSTGPVARFTKDPSLPLRYPMWVLVVYRPLDWLQANTPLDKPLAWYMGLWTD